MSKAIKRLQQPIIKSDAPEKQQELIGDDILNKYKTELGIDINGSIEDLERYSQSEIPANYFSNVSNKIKGIGENKAVEEEVLNIFKPKAQQVNKKISDSPKVFTKEISGGIEAIIEEMIIRIVDEKINEIKQNLLDSFDLKRSKEFKVQLKG